MLEKMSAKGEKQHPIFKFLTQSNPDKSGSVSWNFNKFIINKNGQVTERFGSFTKPSSKKIISAINKELIQDTDT